MDLYKEFRKAATERPVALREAKANGTKIVEFIGNFIPEEMIYAAGAEAYLMCRGGEPEAPDAVLDDMLRFTNPLARSMAGFYRLGIDPVTPHVDMLAASQHECHVQRLAEYLEFLDLPVHKVGVAVDWDKPFAQEYYYKELIEFKEKLEELTGNKITDEKLYHYIDLYNQINGMLRKISELRKSDAPPISGSDFIRLNHYSYLTRPEYALEQLTKIYEQLKDAPAVADKKAPRLLVIGHSVAIGDYIVMDKLEELGAVIVNERLEEGMRWYEEDTKNSGDPIRDIWRQKYMDTEPLNIFQPAWKQRFASIEKTVKEYNIDGIIWYQLLYDEIWDMEYTCLAKRMDERDIPLLRVETSYEYTRESILPLNTRLESFIETLKSRKGGK